jgi:hypothetical protein
MALEHWQQLWGQKKESDAWSNVMMARYSMLGEVCHHDKLSKYSYTPSQ